ncbi:type VI secretion system baseplate subunit TssF [Mucilaginibacter sp. P25]|uniref:type VI secretion system baseplate subunit TssF n=1 Tax=unclassified Mucilaginibacter TaxID=2617802 RepID=UPI003D66E5B2
MSAIFYNSKEEIRNRMLKNATEFWGVQNVNDVDPLVKLLIEALSTELFNLNNDVKNLEHRILNKISRILASDYLTAPLPAYAILKGKPIEASEILNIGNHFYFRKQLAAEVGKTSPEQLDIYFTPAGSNSVFNAEIKYSFNGGRLQEHIENGQKNTLLSVRTGAFGEPNTLWIGIETAVALNTFKNAGIYFDWPVYISNTDFYSLLQVTKFYLDGSQLDTEPGLIYADEQADDQKPVFYDQHIINLITRDVRTYYNNHFISLTDERLSNITAFKANYPVELLSFFNEQDLKSLKPCLWFKIVFPAAIPANAIDELQLHLNCFPVMSRRLHQQKFRIKEISDIIPIKPGAYDHFLSIHELHDDNNVRYNEIPYSQAGINYEGSYSIRNGGAERFDARNARQTIEYLFELLRDEKAAFAAYGSDFLTTALKTLEQNISIIEKSPKVQKIIMNW